MILLYSVFWIAAITADATQVDCYNVTLSIDDIEPSPESSSVHFESEHSDVKLSELISDHTGMTDDNATNCNIVFNVATVCFDSNRGNRCRAI